MKTATEAVAACRVCSVRTSSNLVPRQVRLPDGTLQDADGYVSGLCPDCEALPEVGRGVAAALALLGKENEDLGLAAQAFDEVGVDVSRLLYGEGREPQRRPWAHVSRETRADLRRGAARLLDLKVHRASDHDRPVPPHAPPEGRGAGCAYCGLAAAEQWTAINTYSLTRGPDLLAAVLCPACTEATESVGGVGISAVEKALAAARGLDWSDSLAMRGLRPWADLDLPPSSTGWEFVGEVRAPEPPPTLADAFQAIEALTRRVAELEAGQGK